MCLRTLRQRSMCWRGMYALLVFASVSTLSHALVESSSAALGEPCEFKDGAVGICEDMLACRRGGGVFRRLDTLVRCDLLGEGKSLSVCCRRPQLIANKLCAAWTPYWERSSNEEGTSSCSGHSLVHGGEEAALGEFPHMVAVGVEHEKGAGPTWDCGGSLITPMFVLTAAHCIRPATTKHFVRLGEHDLNDRSASKSLSRLEKGLPEGLAGMDLIRAQTDTHAPVEITISVNETILYPDYQRIYHDIALLRLEKPAVLTSRVLPACLPKTSSEEFSPTTRFTVAGWGATYFGELADNKDNRKLQKVEVKNIEATLCWLKMTSHQNLLLGITTDMICAGAVDKDTCQGDSGGPLMLERKMHCEPFQVAGIVSFGPPCKDIGAYTRVSRYLDWITAIVAPKALP